VAYSLRGCINAELASIGGTFLGIPAWGYQVVPLALGPMMLMWIGDRITNCGARPFPLLLSPGRLCLLLHRRHQPGVLSLLTGFVTFVVLSPSGIGQGFSLLLCISILGEYTHSFRAIAASYATGMLSAQSIGLVLGTFVFMVVGTWPICVQYVDVRRKEGVWAQPTRMVAAHVPSDGRNARSLLPC
jgi:preprotein translocase subunit SecY